MVADPPLRSSLEDILRSDRSFREDEIGVALELIDAALAGSPEYSLIIDPQRRGYACWGRTLMTEASVDLYWIVVAAHARGQGVGSSLVRSVEAAAGRGAGIRVETSDAPIHEAARRMYDRLGYAIVGTINDFYAPGETLITYWKRV